MAFIQYLNIMALVIADLVQETTSTTGTGTLTLSGTVSGFQSFAAIGNANTTYYRIKSGTDSEVGLGTYTASGTTLSRDTVLYSSAGGTTKITVAAGAFVICTYPANKAVALDSSGNLSLLGNINLPYGTIALPAIAFSSATNTGIWGSGSGATAAVGISCNGKSTVTIKNVTSTFLNALDILASNTDVSLKVSGTGTGHLTLNAKTTTGYVRIGTSSAGVLINTLVGLSGANNFIVGTISGNGSNNIAMGGTVSPNSCNGSGNILLGSNNSSNSDGNISIGSGNGSNFNNNILIGRDNYSDYSNCVGIGGNITPYHDYSTSFNNSGYTQRSLYCLVATTVGVVTSQLFLDGFSQPAVPIINRVIALKGQILVYNDVAGYALFDIVVMANTTAVLGSTVTLVYATGTLSTLPSTNITASVTGAALSINVTGLAGLTVEWQATLDSTGG